MREARQSDASHTRARGRGGRGVGRKSLGYTYSFSCSAVDMFRSYLCSSCCPSEKKTVQCVTKLPISFFPISFLFIPIWVPFPTTLKGISDQLLGKTRPPQGKTRPEKGNSRPPRRAAYEA